jgi:hypothetical protein
VKRQLSFGLIVLALASLACQVSLTPRPTPLPPPSATATVTLTPLPTQTKTPTVTPTPPLTTSGGPALLELHMFSATRGWGLTEDQILITNDGGVNWAQVPLPGAKVDVSTSAYFLGESTAYFFAPPPGSQVGQFFATSDRGATWKISLTPFTNAKLYFADERVGFALQTLNVADNLMSVAVYQTVDFGANWRQVFIHTATQKDTNLPVAGIKTGLSFGNIYNGFIGMLAQDNSVGLYRTQDSGYTWAKQELALPARMTAYQATVWPPYFLPGSESNNGFLPVDFIAGASGASTRVFYTTNDVGATWEKGEEIPDGAAYFFVTTQTGWAWGGHSLYTTSDGAKTWTELPVGFNRSERASIIDFVDSQRGWLATVDGKNILRLYQTSDGGGTWTAIIL